MNNLSLSPRLQKLVDMGESGTDILHGELKNLMYETEKVMLAIANDEPLGEDEYDESDEYLQGRLTALSDVYQLTYKLAFAISDRRKNNA
jgi:hypothetical protein